MLHSVAQPKSLPESLAAAGNVLLAGDCVAGTFCVAIFAVLHRAAPAFLTVVAILLCGIAIGRYRTSFALTARDEWYQAAAIALLATPFGWLFSLMLGFSWWVPLATGILWTIVAAPLAATLHRVRRGPQRYIALCEDFGRTRPRTTRALHFAAIRFFDIIFSLCAIVVGLPIFAAVALFIVVRDGLPVLFLQRRVGRDESDFMLVKFRTMRASTDKSWVTPGDARITPLGAVLRRTSLDELPQFFNVLAGTMSLVGPRPEMREYADAFAQDHRGYSWRHVLRPGLTGWAQLHMPRNLRAEDVPSVLEHDLFYVENACTYLYAYCLVKTACELLWHRAV
jgi:lipopolysaccharide/colanic/teichoic acid biosynthesis glycosyltransferase